MNFLEFRNKFFGQRAFSTLEVGKEWADFNFVNLVNWQKKGYLLKIRNGWYAFPEALKSEADLFFLANRIHRPSYVSLETALRHYHFIPESVFSITSVTTGKPAEWQTPVGHFAYRSVKPALFFGYQPSGTQPVFLMADPEKTLLDFLYFNPRLTESADYQELRLNAAEISETLRLDRLHGYLRLIGSITLEKRWTNLQKFLGL